MTTTSPPSIEAELKAANVRLRAENEALREALLLLADDESDELARFMSGDLRQLIRAVRSVAGRRASTHQIELERAKGEYNRMLHGYPDQSGPAARTFTRLEQSVLSVREDEQRDAERLRETYPDLHAAAAKHAQSVDERLRRLELPRGRKYVDVDKRRLEMATTRREAAEIRRVRDEAAEQREKLLERLRGHVEWAAREFDEVEQAKRRRVAE